MDVCVTRPDHGERMAHLKGEQDEKRSEAEPPAWLELGLFGLVAAAVGVIFVLRWGLSFEAGDLIDTDGYMRFLRAHELLENGGWFDPVSTRSNYPFGETLHWTRPLDAIIVAGAFLLTPFLGESALYASAVAFGPVSLVALGASLRWAFGGLVPAVVRSVLLPGLLALPVVLGYAVPGRVDHHSLLFVLLILTIGGTLRILDRPDGTSTVLVGVLLTLGLWVSPEFLVPAALVAITLGWHAVTHPGSSTASMAMRVFITAAAGSLVAVILERGPGWTVVDYARLSLVHSFTLLMVGIAFGGYALLVRSGWTTRRRLSLLAVLALGSALALVLIFPKVLGGPFVDFSPLVMERWLFRVVELRSILSLGVNGLLLNLAWALLALAIGGVAWLRRADRAGERWLWVTYGWMLTYVALSLYQMRWATFAQLLAVPILVASLGPLYQKLQTARLAVLARPVLMAVVIGLVAFAGPRLAAAPHDVQEGVECSLSPVIPVLDARPTTTLLAEQDVGPEIMYRTRLNVVATPYGNEQAFLYTFDVMAERDRTAVREQLDERDIGLILLCPGRLDIMRPENPSGTFYEALVTGRYPDFVRPISLPDETDYLLFAVES